MWTPVYDLACDDLISDFERTQVADPDYNMMDDGDSSSGWEEGPARSEAAPPAVESASARKNRAAAASTSSIKSFFSRTDGPDFDLTGREGGAEAKRDEAREEQVARARSAVAHREPAGHRPAPSPLTRKNMGTPTKRAAFVKHTPTSSPAKKKGRVEEGPEDTRFLPGKIDFGELAEASTLPTAEREDGEESALGRQEASDPAEAPPPGGLVTQPPRPDTQGPLETDPRGQPPLR